MFRCGHARQRSVSVTSNAGDDDEAGPTVAFTSPVDGASVAGGVELAMTADGVTIEEAGEVHGGAGHFHVVADAGCVPEGESIVRDADHVHFGGGQTDGVIYLEPGAHELCLQVGDGVHIALDITYQATVEVGINDRDQWCAVMGEVDGLFESTDARRGRLRRPPNRLREHPSTCHANSKTGSTTSTPTCATTSLRRSTGQRRPPRHSSTPKTSRKQPPRSTTILARYEAPGELPGTEWVDEHCESNISD